MDFANRGYLGSLTHFVKEYAMPIQTHRDAQRRAALQACHCALHAAAAEVGQEHHRRPARQDRTGPVLHADAGADGAVRVGGARRPEQHRGRVRHLQAPGPGAADDPGAQAGLQPSGAVPQAGRSATPRPSGKAERLLDLLDEIDAAQREGAGLHPVSRDGRTAVRVAARAPGAGAAALFLHGGVARGQRDEMVERFQTDRTASASSCSR